MVAERLTQDGGCAVYWQWKQLPSEANDIDQRVELEVMLQQCALTTRRDTWEWQDKKNGVFTVAGAKKWLTSQNGNTISFGFKWCKWVPAKCNIFMWRAFLDRIPTKTTLRRRNIQVQDEECVMCGEGLDSTDHILTECGIA
ncbi:putative reverse transcriptase zinc-binding domain-containing protein [Helianthus annuus]|uniref:uncharacterized protein LOC110919141 n=1 Tax=Helianthus annuus TaxID=4232 RepID=UPI000B8FB167|nr:uncharacterized protein LOC110919141 [Helianthus annuus]KAJ0846576.1 putative reverse transcriptase zinc-binding domain-containing protein [Helianthus annuus]